MEASVSLKKIGKNIEKESILAGLSFGIERGSITSILGPNDSGKSLLLNMIAGGLSPDFGSIYINGNNIVNREKKIFSKIGYMPQYINLDENLNILENFQFHARLYEMNQKLIVERISFLSEQFRIDKLLYKFPKELSFGFLRKIMLVRTLLHDPSIILLDEPLISLDLKSKNRFWKFINKIKDDKTIIYTTQYLKEIENIDERIIFLSDGKIVLDGTYNQLINKTGNLYKFVLKFKNLNDKLFNELSNNSLLIESKRDKNIFEFYGKNKEELFKVLKNVLNDNLIDIEINKIDLDTLFLNSTKEWILNIFKAFFIRRIQFFLHHFLFEISISLLLPIFFMLAVGFVLSSQSPVYKNFPNESWILIGIIFSISFAFSFLFTYSDIQTIKKSQLLSQINISPISQISFIFNYLYLDHLI